MRRDSLRLLDHIQFEVPFGPVKIRVGDIMIEIQTVTGMACSIHE